LRSHLMLRMALPGVLVIAMALVAGPATAGHEPAASDNMDLVFHSPNSTGAVNSDLAFWGDRAYAGNYDGFRIFDVSNPANPLLLEDFPCFGPQNDPIVWKNKLLFLAIDRTLEGPQCGADATAHDDPDGWEGVRIFDVSNPSNPEFIKGVYLDCGAHTITLYPKGANNVLIYASSYPLRPGPTCGQVNGPAAGRDPLHGVIQVIQVNPNKPSKAEEIAEPKIVYPGDPDNKIVWAEHGLPPPPALEPAARACHDISVNVQLKLAASACAEQGQVWRIRANGLPDTQNPIWVTDDELDETGITGDPADTGVAVDFYHSATFSWDGTVVNFIDESFGVGCPPTTPNSHHPADTGRAFFHDASDGTLLSVFMLDPTHGGAVAPGDAETDYCSAHMGLPVPSTSDNLLVNAWYLGGTNIVDFNDPTNPVEVAYYDVLPPGNTGSDNWSAYWYEGPSLPGDTLTIYATDGVHDPAAVAANGRGFNVFSADIATDEVSFSRLNPQTQEVVIE
jgi:hypothetical protein